MKNFKVLPLLALFALCSAQFTEFQPDENARDALEHPDLQEAVQKIFIGSTGGGRGHRIVNGIVAGSGQFPHQALLNMFGSAGTYMCGASFIRFNWVLTVS